MTANEPPFHNYNFCEDAHGRYGYGNASESKEILYLKAIKHFFQIIN